MAQDEKDPAPLAINVRCFIVYILQEIRSSYHVEWNQRQDLCPGLLQMTLDEVCGNKAQQDWPLQASMHRRYWSNAERICKTLKLNVSCMLGNDLRFALRIYLSTWFFVFYLETFYWSLV